MPRVTLGRVINTCRFSLYVPVSVVFVIGSAVNTFSLGTGLWMTGVPSLGVERIFGSSSSLLADALVCSCSWNTILSLFRVWFYKLNVYGFDVRLVQHVAWKRILFGCSCAWSGHFLLQLLWTVHRTTFRRFGHYRVPDIIMVLFLPSFFCTLQHLFCVLQKLLEGSFIEFSTKTCSICIPIVSFLEILENLSQYISSSLRNYR